MKSRKRNVFPLTVKKQEIAGIIVAILVACIIGFGIGRRSYKQVLKEGLKSIQTESAEKLIKLFPKEFVEYVEESYDMSYEEYCDWLQDILESENETLVNRYGKHYKMKLQIKDVDKYSKDRLGDLNQELYDSYGFDKKKTAKAAAEIKVEITTSGNDNRDSQIRSFEVMKIGRKWYFTTKLGGMLTPFRW